MSSTFISGDVIKFKNPFTKQDVVLQHTDSGYDLIFNSNVVFGVSSNHTTITIGRYTIKTSDVGGTGELEIYKNETDLLLTLNKN
tara:strand:+ start:2322 stop:2576 length:255 start_codon:yes stop_codon:yes gene_type:complete